MLQCWDKSPSARPTAQELFHCLQDAFHTWAPPLEYPIHDGPEGGAGLDFTSVDARSIVSVLVCFFVLVGGISYLLLLPLT